MHKEIDILGPFVVKSFDLNGNSPVQGKFFAYLNDGGDNYLRSDGTVQKSTGFGNDNSGYFDSFVDVKAAYEKYCTKKSAPPTAKHRTIIAKRSNNSFVLVDTYKVGDKTYWRYRDSSSVYEGAINVEIIAVVEDKNE